MTATHVVVALFVVSFIYLFTLLVAKIAIALTINEEVMSM